MEEKRNVLIDLVTVSYDEQKRYLESMSDESRAAVGKVDDWSPKDVLAHVVHWDSMVAVDLADPWNREPDQDGDYNQMNARIWEQYKDYTWVEIEALIDQTHEAMVNNLQRLSEEDLSDPDRFEWLNGRALWRSVAFTSYYHAVQHVAVLYANQGDLGYANQVQEQTVEQQTRLSDSDDWRGTVLYNLGCHYAITGQKDKALEQIDAGLKLYPTLSKWAPDDPDLESLRSDPDFIALIASD